VQRCLAARHPEVVVAYLPAYGTELDPEEQGDALTPSPPPT
jgi:hypothetical protein